VESFRPRPFFEPSRGAHGQQGLEPFLLKPRQAAQRLAISERYLYQLTSSGEVPCVRIGKLVRYSIETLRKWVKDRETVEHQPLPRKAPPKRTAVQPRQALVPQPASKRRSPKRKKPVSAPELTSIPAGAQTASARSRNEVESAERSSRLCQFLKSVDIDPSQLPPLTNGELMRAAGVDLVQWHGWSYLGKALPDEAMERLTHHLRQLASSPRPR
jgi:excisionase family DNA binding protein